MKKRTSLIALLIASALSLSASARDWYRWRGPEQTGVSREKGLPDAIDPDSGDNVLWKAPYGGMSSPIVMNGKVYTLSRTGEEIRPDTVVAGPKTQETVVCVDAFTGKPVWEHKMQMTQTEVPFHRLGWSNPVGDPATGKVYVFGSQCNLVCFNGEDGKVLWQRQLTEEFGVISTFGGRTASPSIDEDQVFIGGVAFGWGDHAGAQYRVFAFNKANGELNWTTGSGGLPVDSPYQTCSFAVIDGQRQVITGAGDGKVVGFQTRTGRKIWEYQGSKRGLNASVLVDGTLVYYCSSEVNIDNSASGTVRCIDVAGAKPKEVWRHDQVEAGFSSPTLFDGTFYVCDNSATIYAYDAKTGKEHWRRRCGTIGKASLVIADGKIYMPEANGRMTVLKLAADNAKPTVASTSRMEDKPGREYVYFGSVAPANGRIYFQSAGNLYCMGPKDAKAQDEPLPELAKEPAEVGAAAALLVTPADIVLHPDQKQQFAVHAFDAMGRPTPLNGPMEWSIGKLMLPPPPVRPGAPATQPVGPKPIGNLMGEVAADGTYIAAKGPHQGGGVFVKVAGLIGFARVRVMPPLPWKFDFEQTPVGSPPLTWLGAGGKFSVQELDGNKFLDKVPLVDLYYRARTNFGTPDMTNYTLSADVRAGEKIMGGQHQIPDPGLINQHYVLQLYGNDQLVEIHTWAGALPTVQSASSALNKRVPFTWKADTWYRMKLRVDQLADKAVAHGKIWPAGEKEPDAWTIELEDTLPSRSGNPGLFGHSLVTPYKSDLLYDNILVEENK